MIISCLKEIKVREGRVCLIPSNVVELVAGGHTVYIQKNAGVNAGFSDADYRKAGAKIVAKTKDLIAKADLVVKVKEPSIQEIKMMRAGQMFFGYLHLAPIPQTLKVILQKRITALGFETLQLADGSLPLLAPMSEIAGKLATQNGAHFLTFSQGGRGVLIGGTATVKPSKVIVLGGGVVGQSAADIAIGMGAHTTIFESQARKIEFLKQKYGTKADIVTMDSDLLAHMIKEVDLVVGGVLIVGEKAPKIVTAAMVKSMKKGTVIVDVSVDQGGCVATSEVTTHEKPIVVKHGVLHYGVANMPGSVPVTSTLALNNASFKYIKALCDNGLDGCLQKYPEMQLAVNCRDGVIMHDGLKQSQLAA